MTLSGSDLRKLRWHLAAFLGMAALALTLALQSRAVREEARVVRQAAETKARQMSDRLRRVRTEEEEIKERSAMLVAMQRDGTLGRERRLEWTELLRSAQRRLRIPEISYEFGPSTPLPANAPNEVAFYSSPMKLRLQLLHEEDLLRYLALLRGEAPALVVVRACTLGKPVLQGSLPRQDAQCDLDWITARLPGTPAEQRP